MSLNTGTTTTTAMFTAGPIEPRSARLAKLRVPFPPEQIGKLPRVTCPACRKKNCSEHNKARCQECRNYMTTAHMHLDYVGHAAVTDRLLSVDPEWTWRPMGKGDDGTPVWSVQNGKASMWIELTVCGHTRLGVGVVDYEPGHDVEKELISDAIRNAAMRFGVALDLWSKEDLQAQAEDGGSGAGVGTNPGSTSAPAPPSEEREGGSGEPSTSETEEAEPPAPPAQLTKLRRRLRTLDVADAAIEQALNRLYGVGLVRELTPSQADDFYKRIADDQGSAVRRLKELSSA